MTERQWCFRSRASDFERITPLWLYPEIDGSSCVADAEDQSGAGQLADFVAFMNSAHADSGRKSGSFERSSTGRSRPEAVVHGGRRPTASDAKAEVSRLHTTALAIKSA